MSRNKLLIQENYALDNLEKYYLVKKVDTREVVLCNLKHGFKDLSLQVCQIIIIKIKSYIHNNKLTVCSV